MLKVEKGKGFLWNIFYKIVKKHTIFNLATLKVAIFFKQNKILIQ